MRIAIMSPYQTYSLTDNHKIKEGASHFLAGDEYEYFFFVTNTELRAEKVVISYEKRGNAENYIKEAKYDMAVGHLLLQSFWAAE